MVPSPAVPLPVPALCPPPALRLAAPPAASCSERDSAGRRRPGPKNGSPSLVWGGQSHVPLCAQGIKPDGSWAGSVPPARHCNRCGMLWVKPKNKQKLEVLEILGEQMTPTHRRHPGLKRVEEWACAPPPPSQCRWLVALAWCRSPPQPPSNPALLLHAAGGTR